MSILESNSQKSYCRRPRIPWQEVQGQALLLNTPAAKVHELNATAAWIWKKLETPQSFENLFSEFLASHQIELEQIPEAQKALMQLLNDLESEGLLT